MNTFNTLYRSPYLPPRYTAVVCTYGFVHKARVMKDARLHRIKGNPVDVSNTSKAAMTLIGGTSALYIWPIFIYQDLKMIVRYLNKKEQELLELEHVLDYYWI